MGLYIEELRRPVHMNYYNGNVKQGDMDHNVAQVGYKKRVC